MARCDNSKVLALFAALSIILIVGGCNKLTSRDVPTLTEQKMCADQAEKSFNDSKPSAADDVIRYTFTNHYDPKQEVCYVETHTAYMDSKSQSTAENIFDAFEGREYGSFQSLSSPSKPDFVDVCSITPRDHAEIKCSSSDEFDKIALQYFGTTPD